MTKHLVRIVCWKKSHVNDLAMTIAGEKKLDSDIPKMKKVCPDCKPENSEITIVRGSTLFNDAKSFKCDRGHLTNISAMTDMLNLRHGSDSEDFVNVKAHIDELSNLIDNREISCNHVVDGVRCDCKLHELDDYQLMYPSIAAIKTKTRIGDLWDRHGIEPVRPGSYGKDGEFNESKSERANRSRLKQIQKQRNLEQDRYPGKRIEKSTDRDYGHKNKSSVNPDRIKFK